MHSRLSAGAAAALLILVGCSNRRDLGLLPDGGSGGSMGTGGESAGTGGIGGVSGSGGGGGAPTAARVVGTITTVGSAPAPVGGIRLVKQGIGVTGARTCGGSVCLDQGGISP